MLTIEISLSREMIYDIIYNIYTYVYLHRYNNKLLILILISTKDHFVLY